MHIPFAYILKSVAERTFNLAPIHFHDSTSDLLSHYDFDFKHSKITLVTEKRQTMSIFGIKEITEHFHNTFFNLFNMHPEDRQRKSG